MTIAVADAPPSGWDERILRSGPEGSLEQTTFWARIRSRAHGSRPLFITVTDAANEPVASLLAVITVQRRFGFEMRTLEWSGGPVLHVDDAERALQAFDESLEGVLRAARGARAWRIHSTGLAHASRWSGDSRMHEKAAAHGFEVHPWATLLVDLNPAEDALLAAVDHSIRKNIKKCQRENVRVVTIDSETAYMSRFIAAYNAMESQAGRVPIPDRVAQIAYEEDTARRYRYFVAESDDGEPLATLGMYVFNGVATEIASSIARTAIERKLPAQDAVHWAAMLAAKAAGCAAFDLAGINPQPGSAKEEGIRRYKAKWNGRIVPITKLERVRPGLWQTIASLKRRFEKRGAPR